MQAFRILRISSKCWTRVSSLEAGTPIHTKSAENSTSRPHQHHTNAISHQDNHKPRADQTRESTMNIHSVQPGASHLPPHWNAPNHPRQEPHSPSQSPNPYPPMHRATIQHHRRHRPRPRPSQSPPHATQTPVSVRLAVRSDWVRGAAVRRARARRSRGVPRGSCGRDKGRHRRG